MTDILLNWINNEVKLSKNINNISDDFSNGYFFGELLYKYKLLPQFNQLRNSNEKSSITKNYIILQHKFDELKINFTDKDKIDIINKKKYKAEIFLFKIREKLLSKLLQIDKITERINNQKELNKLYKHVMYNTNPHPRVKSAKTEIKNNVGAISIINEEKKETENEDEKEEKNKNKSIKKKRLESARLPKLSKKSMNIGKNKQYVMGVESIVVNNTLNKKENRMIKDTLKEIELFDNIHMKTKKNIEVLENKKHINEELKEKHNLDSWKKSYQKIKKFEEEKKEKDLQKIKRLKSATQKSFNQTNQNYLTFINKFDQNLDQLGLKSTKELNENQKKNELSSENYMKSIIEAVKEKELLRKQYEIRIRRINGPNKPDNIIEDKKDGETNIDIVKNEIEKEKGKKRPKSSATTLMFFNNKNKSVKGKINILENKRPLTSKNAYKNQIDLKKPLADINKPNSDNKNLSNKAFGKFNSQINTFDLSIGGSQLSKIAENSSLINSNRREYNIPFDEYINNDVYDENKFFEKVYREGGNYFQNKAKERHKEIAYNRKIIKNIVYSLLDITDLCFNYKNIHNTKLVDIEEWNKMINNFINNKPIIPKKEKPKPKIEEDFDNSTFNLYNPIKEEEIKEYEQYEYDELKNFIYFFGDKYDPEKNCLFVKKCKLGQDKLDINDVMGEMDVKILCDEAIKAGRKLTTDDDDKEDSENNKYKIRYKANKEEQELLEPYKEKYPSNLIFTGLIYESIKFSYDKDPKTFKPKDNTSKVIEEEINFPPQVEIVETEGSIKKNIVGDEKSKISDENKNEHINSIIEEEKLSNIKDLIESIPIRVSFLGAQKTEKKTRAKNLEKRYPGLKVYNISDLKKNLEVNNKDINDINIIDLLINKIREDFHYKEKEDIRKEIIKRRENIMNLNNEIEKLKEDQEKKIKTNVAKDIQNIQQQIDKIINESIIGFILIGIPENISQLKIMEKEMMDFTQPCEKSINTFNLINDNLLFICDQPQKETKEIEFIDLTLNKIIHFESNKDVIFEKIDNRKKDPVKGDIYQMDLFPPKDKKILARLEDIVKPTHEDIEEDILKDTNNYELIEEFYSNFNTKCINFVGYIINENISSITNYRNYMQLLEQNQIELDNKISKEIEEALTLYEDKMVGPVNDNLPLIEESGIIENKDEISVANKEKEKKGSEFSGENNNNILSNKKITQQQISKKEVIRDSINSSMTLINDISRINSNNYINSTQGEISVSHFNFFPPSSLSEIELFSTYHLWKKFIYFYTNQYYKKFNKDKKLGRGKYIERLNSIQNDFIKFLSRPSDKKIIINQFLNKYKEFSNKFRFIQNTTIARGRYLSDIEELNETLWKIVEIRKFEALDKIDSLSQIIDQELKVCYYNIEQMVILETQKFLEIINILLRFISKNKLVQLNANTNLSQYYMFIIDNPTEEILRECDNSKLAEYNEKTKKYNYPKANRIYKNCLRILIKLHNYLTKNIFKPHEKLISTISSSRGIKRQKTKKKIPKVLSKQSSLSNKSQIYPKGSTKTNEVQNQLKLSIKAEMEKYKYIIYNIYINSLETLSKIYCASKLVFKLMDNWIIDSLQYQNNAMKAIFTKLKSYSIDDILKNKNLLSEDNIYRNIELDDFSKKYILFNYNDFLSDGKSDENQNLSIEELNNKEIAKNIMKIFKLFTNFGNSSNDNIFGELISTIRESEIQKGIIKKSSFEKIFFINKIVVTNNKTLFPQFFYDFDFHNISKFLSHFIKLSSDFIDTNTIKKENESKEINSKSIEGEQKNKSDNNNINKEENGEIDKENKNENKPQELIYTNQILSILFLICFKVVSEKDIEKIKNENENKFINGKYLNKNDFISVKFWFEDIINKKCKSEKDLSEQFKVFLFDLNSNKNNMINFIEFINLISLNSLNFNNDLGKNEIKNYFDLFYH